MLSRLSRNDLSIEKETRTVEEINRGSKKTDVARQVGRSKLILSRDLRKLGKRAEEVQLFSKRGNRDLDYREIKKLRCSKIARSISARIQEMSSPGRPVSHRASGRLVLTKV